MSLHIRVYDLGHPHAAVCRGEDGALVVLDQAMDPRAWCAEVLPLLSIGEAVEFIAAIGVGVVRI